MQQIVHFLKENVFLTEEIPPQYLYKVSNDDPELLEVLENLEEE